MFTHSGRVLAIFSSGAYRGKEKGAQTAETFRGNAISHWLSAFGAPEILVFGEDMGFIGN